MSKKKQQADNDNKRRFTIDIIGTSNNCAEDFMSQVSNKAFTDRHTESVTIGGVESDTNIFNRTQQDKFRTASRKHLGTSDAIIVVCDGAETNLMNSLKEAVQTRDRYAADAPVILVGMTDQVSDQLKEFAEQQGDNVCVVDGQSNGALNIHQILETSVIEVLKTEMPQQERLPELSSSQEKQLEKIINMMEKSAGAKTKLGAKLAEVKADAMIRKLDGPDVVKACVERIKENLSNPTNMSAKETESMRSAISKLQSHESDLATKSENISSIEMRK